MGESEDPMSTFMVTACIVLLVALVVVASVRGKNKPSE